LKKIKKRYKKRFYIQEKPILWETVKSIMKSIVFGIMPHKKFSEK